MATSPLVGRALSLLRGGGGGRDSDVDEGDESGSASKSAEKKRKKDKKAKKSKKNKEELVTSTDKDTSRSPPSTSSLRSDATHTHIPCAIIIKGSPAIHTNHKSSLQTGVTAADRTSLNIRMNRIIKSNFQQWYMDGLTDPGRNPFLNITAYIRSIRLSKSCLKEL